MIVFLDGVLEEKEPTRVVVAVGGVGYEAAIPLSSYDRLPGIGQRVRLLVVPVVREDAHLLYGFTSAEERDAFRLLTSVNGIGPKLGLAVLSGLSVRDLKAAVAAGDVKRLGGISGIGKKTAERLVLEMRDKLGKAELTEALAGGGAPSTRGGRSISARMCSRTPSGPTVGCSGRIEARKRWAMACWSRPNMGSRLAFMSATGGARLMAIRSR